MTHLDDFIATIARLRGPDGCPWDREQDHLSLARYLLEEAYEVLEAIHSGSPAKLKEELGDLLLQIVLNAQVAQDYGEFNIEDVADGINQKMIKRHPHVFGDTKAENSAQVVKRWEELKHEEAKEKQNGNLSVVDNVPNTLPALLKALKVSEKAVSVGFEWESLDDVWSKVLSEIDELRHELTRPPEQRNRKKIELELGDVLFTLVNVGRWEKMNPEESLLLAIDKFRTRFREMEKLSSKPLKELTPAQMNDLWEEAKKITAPSEG
ncbi:MAG TPA: nucleoside triphosphate pyrophosphohydrolase [Candidatus Obscuribacterales bacterium]